MLSIHRDEGEGAPVVLIHGFPDTARTWDGIADRLVAQGHRVVVPHLRGYTPDGIDATRGYSARELAQDVLDLLDGLGLDSAVLVGHDWGASMAYGATALAPARTRGLVGVAIPHPRAVRMTPSLAWDARHFLALRMPWAAAQFRLGDLSGVDILYRRWAPTWDDEAREECIRRVKAAFADPPVLQAALAYYKAFDPRPDRRLSARLDVPALVVGGRRDIVPAQAFAASDRGFTGPLRVEVYPDAGHWPHREDEGRFTADLLDFVAGLRGDG